MLVKVAGTPFAELDDLDPLEFVRTIARRSNFDAKIPCSFIRRS